MESQSWRPVNNDREEWRRWLAFQYDDIEGLNEEVQRQMVEQPEHVHWFKRSVRHCICGFRLTESVHSDYDYSAP